MDETHETLLGYKDIDFVDDKGNPVKGKQIFTAYGEDGVTGKACGKLFIREGTIQLPPLTVGMALNIAYNRKGKVASIKAVTAPATKP